MEKDLSLFLLGIACGVLIMRERQELHATHGRMWDTLRELDTRVYQMRDEMRADPETEEMKPEPERAL